MHPPRKKKKKLRSAMVFCPLAPRERGKSLCWSGWTKRSAGLMGLGNGRWNRFRIISGSYDFHGILLYPMGFHRFSWKLLMGFHRFHHSTNLWRLPWRLFPVGISVTVHPDPSQVAWSQNPKQTQRTRLILSFRTDRTYRTSTCFNVL